MANTRQGKLVVLSGSSGSGKGTVIHSLFSRYEGFCFSVSVTTRAPRPGERDGIDYHFITRERFDTLVADEALLEYAEYVGNCYGTPRDLVFRKLGSGMNVVLEIDPCGAKQIKARFPDAVLIFVSPPTYRELRERLIGRATESAEKIAKRLLTARQEALDIPAYDYVIINRSGHADEAADAIYSIVSGQYKDDIDKAAFAAEFLSQE